MIRNETEYQEASARLTEERTRLAEHRGRLREAGLSDIEIKRVIDPMESFHLQLQEEVESYERLKRGEFDDLDNLRGLGHLLISTRVAQGYRSANWLDDSKCTSPRSRGTSAMNTTASRSKEPLKSLMR